MKWPHIRITNPSTGRSKHVRIAPSQGRKSIYDVIYSNPDVIAANIHDWPSDELKRMTENLVEIKLSVVDINNNILATFSIDEMKAMEVSTLSTYSDGHDSNGGVVEMVLHCQEKQKPIERAFDGKRTKKSEKEILNDELPEIERHNEALSREDLNTSFRRFQSSMDSRMNGNDNSGVVLGSIEPGKGSDFQGLLEVPPMAKTRNFGSMVNRLEQLKKRNEAKLSEIHKIDQERKEEEEKVSKMIASEITPGIDQDASAQMPSWFVEYSVQQERQLKELLLLSEARNNEIQSLTFELTNSKTTQLETPVTTPVTVKKQPKATKEVNVGDDKKYDETYDVEQLETGKKVKHILSEGHDKGCPRHTVGCTQYECHGALMEKNGFGAVSSADSVLLDKKLEEATAFIKQFAEETCIYDKGQLEERLVRIKNDLTFTGTYVHTHDELEFGCRLAWRNSGRCIMRKVSFTLELRDCRQVTTAEECYDQCVDHLKYAFNDGAIKPVISVFRPKTDGKSAPVRIWNRQLLGYAAYRRKDGSIMGDPVNLGFTALCVKFGWEPPEEKSDFDVLPWVISDEYTGHENPKVFKIPADAVEEIEFEHPDHDLFETLNLRWYALPCISNIGVDVGGMYKDRYILFKIAPFRSEMVANILVCFHEKVFIIKLPRSTVGMQSQRLQEIFWTSNDTIFPK